MKFHIEAAAQVKDTSAAKLQASSAGVRSV